MNHAHHSSLAAAADEPGMADLAEHARRHDEPVHWLHLAATVMGSVEAHATVLAADVATGGSRRDPMATVDAAAFAAAGMRGRVPRASEALWGVWTLHRLQARISAVSGRAADPDPAAVSAPIDSAHALLSGLVHRLHGGPTADEKWFVAQARDRLDDAAEILRGP